MSPRTCSSSRSLPEPAFDGPLGELDRRTGGELQALTTFGELTGKRYATALAAGGELPAGRVLAVSMGDPTKLDREIVVRIAATAERRLGGRSVKRLAIWLTPLAEHLDGGAAAVAGLVARGVLEGSYDPRTIYRDEVEARLPDIDELILVAPGADVAALTREAERGVVMAEGSSPRPDPVEPRVQRRQPGGPRRGGPRDRQEARPVDRRHRARSVRPSSGWACSWPSVAAVTTRPG